MLIKKYIYIFLTISTKMVQYYHWVAYSVYNLTYFFSKIGWRGLIELAIKREIKMYRTSHQMRCTQSVGL